MSSHCTKSLLESFKDLEDPRIEYLCDHRLLDIVALSICAVLSGANHWTEVEAYGIGERRLSADLSSATKRYPLA